MLRGLWVLSFISVVIIIIFSINGVHSFYLPGVAPQDFNKGDPLKVKVNKLTSTKTQLPYSYYSVPYCRPDEIVDSAENLGEVLRGDRIENSPFEFEMRVPQMCKFACLMLLNAKTAKDFKEKIDDEYRVNMILDNLPLVVPIQKSDQESSTFYQHGFRIGLKIQYDAGKEAKYFIHNHLAFTVKYHKDLQTDTARIVGFEVKPFSVKHDYEGKWNNKTHLSTCDPHAQSIVTSSESPQEVDDKMEIIFTYDVQFQVQGHINLLKSQKEQRELLFAEEHSNILFQRGLPPAKEPQNMHLHKEQKGPLLAKVPRYCLSLQFQNPLASHQVASSHSVLSLITLS